MVSKKSVEAQLKKLNFNVNGWGRGEVGELHRILLEDEEVYEVVNGIYEGGFALLVATDIRMLLVDKKPLNFLTVEDLRFDMINELDYSHRLIGAHINVSAGSKNLQFRSYNQPRLRKLINHVQHCMADGKKKQSSHQSDQSQHLEQINQQLQEYLLAQHQQQEQLQKQLQQSIDASPDNKKPHIEPVKPSGKLADYLFAQSLLARHKKERKSDHHEESVAEIAAPEQPKQVSAPLQTKELPAVAEATVSEVTPVQTDNPVVSGQGDQLSPQSADLYAEGMNEIYGRRSQGKAPVTVPMALAQEVIAPVMHRNTGGPLEINPMKIAYSKLPLALRNRKFGSPSFHAHSQSNEEVEILSSTRAQSANG